MKTKLERLNEKYNKVNKELSACLTEETDILYGGGDIDWKKIKRLDKRGDRLLRKLKSIVNKKRKLLD